MKSVLVRLSDELVDHIDQLAEADRRSRNQYLTILLEEHFKKPVKPKKPKKSITKTNIANFVDAYKAVCLECGIQFDSFIDDSKVFPGMVKHCYSLINKIGKEEFTYRLKQVLSEPFHATKASKLSYIYKQVKGFVAVEKKPNIAIL